MNEGRIASKVWTRFGFRASFSSTVMAPSAFSSRARIGCSFSGVADHYVAQPLLQILDRVRQTKDRHHLRGHYDVETVLSREAVSGTAQRGGDVAQCAIVHVHHPPPGDPAHVNRKLVAVMDMVVEQRRQQVVAKAMALKSPVKCRLMSSIGTTWA